MEVQGDPAAIAALLERLNRMSYAWIDRMSCVDMEIIEENGFYVRQESGFFVYRCTFKFCK